MPWSRGRGTRTWDMSGSAASARRTTHPWRVLVVAPLLALVLAPVGARADTTTTTSLPPASASPVALSGLSGSGTAMTSTVSSTIEAPTEESPPATTTVPITPTAPPPVDPALLASLHQQLLRAQRSAKTAHAAQRAAQAQAVGLTTELAAARADVDALRAKERAL